MEILPFAVEHGCRNGIQLLDEILDFIALFLVDPELLDIRGQPVLVEHGDCGELCFPIELLVDLFALLEDELLVDAAEDFAVYCLGG